MEENIHLGHRKRLRKDAETLGLCNLQEHQVLELLLSYVIPRKDTNPIAHNLINKFGGFAQVLQAPLEELVKVDGMGEYAGSFLVLLKEFFSYYKKSKLNKPFVIKNIKQAYEFSRELLEDKAVEEFYVIYLNNNSSVISYEKISEGVVNSSNVNIKKITAGAFKFNSGNLILCHNHPEGKAVPSINDDVSTKALLTSLYLNGINVLDHIIVADNSYYSYSASSKLDDYIKDVNKLLNSETLKVCAPKLEYNKEIR